MLGLNFANALARFPWSLFLVGVVMAALLVIALTPVARWAGWIDKPNVRKAHVGEIPLIGGWVLLITVGLLQAAFPLGREVPLGYWIGALLLFAIAVIDDRYPIRARYRFLVQFTAAFAGVSFGGQALVTIGDLLGQGDISWAGLGLVVSVLGTVAVINAVNFTDGADGLCGGIGFIGLGWFVAALMMSATLAADVAEPRAAHAAGMVPFAATMMGALGGFLIFNLRTPWRKRASVFLGDSGSMLIGFTLAWYAVHLTSSYGVASVPPIVCLWVLALPLADLTSCMVRRLLNGIKPSTPDLKHLHHLVPKLGWTPAQSVALIHLGAFLCGLVGVVGWWLGVSDAWLFFAFLVALTGFIAWTYLSWRRIDGPDRGSAVGRSPVSTTLIAPSKGSARRRGPDSEEASALSRH